MAPFVQFLIRDFSAFPNVIFAIFNNITDYSAFLAITLKLTDARTARNMQTFLFLSEIHYGN
jgi:hypothetical protein